MSKDQAAVIVGLSIFGAIGAGFANSSFGAGMFSFVILLYLGILVSK